MGQENLAICKSEGDLYNLEHIGKHWGPCTFVRSLEYRESGTGGFTICMYLLGSQALHELHGQTTTYVCPCTTK